MRCDQLECGARHRDPDVHQQEIDRALDATQGFAQVAFAQIDQSTEIRLLKVRPCGAGLDRLIFGSDDNPAAAGGADVVPQCGSKIEGGDTERGADLHDPARVDRTTKLITEFRLVAIERDELVAAKRLDLVFRRRMGCLARLKAFELRDLAVASGVQAVKQAFQQRVLNDAQGRSFIPSLPAS